MNTMVCALRSGSSGNCIYLESGKTSLLVDAGVNGKTIALALQDIERTPDKLSGILITHEHRDHIAGAGVMARRYKIPLFVNQKTYDAMKSLIGKVDLSLINIIESDKNYSLGDIEFRSFAISHDAKNPVGYRINTSKGDVSVCTDTGVFSDYLIDAVKGCNAIFIEANYDEDMLAVGPYPYFLKKRISGDKGHLSNSDCADAISKLRQTGTEKFILSHLSRDNNLPELAELTVNSVLKKQNSYCDAEVCVAARYNTSKPVIVG